MALFKKQKGGLAALFQGFKETDDEFFDELEEALILADSGVEVAEETVEQLKTACKSRFIRKETEIRAKLADILADEMTKAGGAGMKLDTNPSVILVVGVNGVGKTTSIGKLAKLYKNQGRKVLLCAADTFRAAASEQLAIWAERVGCDIVRHGEGGDPGAVVYDSIAAARARGADLIIVDTAGRLHNKQNLMNELAKIYKILGRELPGCDMETLLVIDATTGQNGILQAESFTKAAGVTGIVLTKLDGTAKGGVVLSIGRKLGVGVKFVGVGEGVDDLLAFDAKQFAEELLS